MSIIPEHVFVCACMCVCVCVTSFCKMILTSNSASLEGVFGEKIKFYQVTAVVLFETLV
jgi:hypothetical protein